jgi:eukaryotic-like serine/threonine-protein kinase
MSQQSAKVERTTVPGGAIVKIGGVINETFKADMLAGTDQESVVIDLEGVRWITSIGVREWINALNNLPASHLVFINVRPSMVLQFNMIHGFAGRGNIVSLYLPYACMDCDEETEVLTDLRKDYAVVEEGPQNEIDCPKCGGTAEFDEIGYLSYVQSQPKPTITDTLSKLIDGDLESLRNVGFKIQKEIAGDITAMWLSGPIRYDLKLKRAALGLEGTIVVVFENVTEVDPRGIVRLESLLFPENAEVHLARVPPALLEALDPNLKSRLFGRVVSFNLPVSCRACGRMETIVSQLDADSDGVPCPKCGKPALIVVPRNVLEKELRRFHEADPPQRVRDYISRRPRGPVAERGISTIIDRRASTADLVARESRNIGRYQIIRQIGSGGMAEVFLASQAGPEGFEKKVVIKKILPRLASDPSFVKMFLQEARLAARISHPNVVQVFELGGDRGSSDDSGEFFIAMEYVKGWSLDAILKALERLSQKVPIDLACRLTADICAGLHAAHTCGDDGRGIVHRDISPHNVLVSEQGSVKIVDFGISKAADTAGDTKTGAIKGKVAYMAPEQIDKRFGEIDRRTDVLATGLVLFEVLTGKPAHKRDTEFRTLMAALECQVPDVRTIRDDIPAGVAEIVTRATQKKAEDRYQSCRDFQLDLEDAIATGGRSGSSAHLARWLEAAAFDAVKEGRLKEPGVSQTGAVDPDNETILK